MRFVAGGGREGRGRSRVALSKTHCVSVVVCDLGGFLCRGWELRLRTLVVVCRKKEKGKEVVLDQVRYGCETGLLGNQDKRNIWKTPISTLTITQRDSKRMNKQRLLVGSHSLLPSHSTPVSIVRVCLAKSRLMLLYTADKTSRYPSKSSILSTLSSSPQRQ